MSKIKDFKKKAASKRRINKLSNKRRRERFRRI